MQAGTGQFCFLLDFMKGFFSFSFYLEELAFAWWAKAMICCCISLSLICAGSSRSRLLMVLFFMNLHRGGGTRWR